MANRNRFKSYTAPFKKMENKMDNKYFAIKCDSKGGFNVPIEFEISFDTCHVCQNKTIVLKAGAGVGEYGFAKICKDCIKRAFNRFESEKSTTSNY